MLKVEALRKSFETPEGPVNVIDGVDFSVAEGKCYVLLGPSGCGKTTTLRCIAGLEHADGGVITIAGSVVSDPARGIFVPVHERPIGMVFQSYAIWPHLDVFENVAYPLRVQRPALARAEIRERVTDVLVLVGMQAMAARPAARLSGGQQQRVALARALVRRPALLLLDEPLSNLDARLRETMRNELSEMIARVGVTALFVTHDQAEAFALADRVAMMDRGHIVQEGAPREIYAQPRAPFIATFLGAANLLDVHVAAVAVDGRRRFEIDTPSQAHSLVLASELAPGTAAELVVRPEDLALSTQALPGVPNVLAGTVVRTSFLGGLVEYGIDVDGVLVKALAHPAIELAPGQDVWLRVDAARCTVFPKGLFSSR